MRVERTRGQWDGLQVDERFWEPRQPQDFVRGVPDRQNVGIARPLPPPTFSGPIFYTLNATAPPLTRTLILQSAAGMAIGDYLGIMLEDGVLFQTRVAGGEILLDFNGNPLLDFNGNALLDSDGVGVMEIGIVDPLPLSALSGSTVIDYKVAL